MVRLERRTLEQKRSEYYMGKQRAYEGACEWFLSNLIIVPGSAFGLYMFLGGSEIPDDFVISSILLVGVLIWHFATPVRVHLRMRSIDRAPRYSERYYRKLPAGTHPAILSGLLGDRPFEESCHVEAFAITVLRLASLGMLDVRSAPFVESVVTRRTGVTANHLLTLNLTDEQIDAMEDAVDRECAHVLNFWIYLQKHAKFTHYKDEEATGDQAERSIEMCDIVELTRHGLRDAKPVKLFDKAESYWEDIVLADFASHDFYDKYVREHWSRHLLLPAGVETRARLLALGEWCRALPVDGEKLPTDDDYWADLLCFMGGFGLGSALLARLRRHAPDALEGERMRRLEAWFAGDEYTAPIEVLLKVLEQCWGYTERNRNANSDLRIALARM